MSFCRRLLPVYLSLLLTSSLSAVPAAAAAVFPGYIEHQGELGDASGNPRAGPHSFQFDLYNQATGGVLLFSDANYTGANAVSVVNGVYSVQIGSLTVGGVPVSVFFNSEVWLEIKVSPGLSLIGAETLTPRERLTASPFAFLASNAEFLGTGVAIATFTTSGNLQVPYGVTAATASFTNTSGFSLATSSGVNVAAGGVYAPFFSGQFIGDGSNLTGVTAPSAVSKTGDTMTGNLFLNTSTLTVNGPIFSTGTSGGAAFSGAGTRFMWVPSSAAIRGGEVGGSQWDPASIGAFSVAFGQNNTASGQVATVGGGANNTVSANYATVGGGSNNTASVGQGATVGGGIGNTASNTSATVPGGANNSAAGAYSFAAGYRANTSLSAQGAFVWADSAGGAGVSLTATIQDQFLARAMGGFDIQSSSFIFANGPSTYVYIQNGGNVGIGTTAPATVLDVNGVAQFGLGAAKSTFTLTGLVMAAGSSVTLSGANGWVTTQSSVTASAFFGDASHLLNGPPDASKVLKTGDVMIGNLFLNTSTLTVNGPIFSTGAAGGVMFSGAGTRFMWVPASAAIRAGSVTGPQWDSVNIGPNSVAFGQDNTASGDHSTIGGGISNVASGLYSVVPGGFLNKAGGGYSFAAGNSAQASAAGSFVWGDSNGGGGGGATVQSSIVDQFLVRAQGGFDIQSSSFIFGNGVSTYVYIQSGGNVGIGTTGPLATLHINGPSVPAGSDLFKVQVNGTGGNFFDVNNNGQILFNPNIAAGSAPLIGFGDGLNPALNIGDFVSINPSASTTANLLNVQLGNTSRMLVTASGNVGIGTTAPAASLTVSSTGGSQVLITGGTGYNTLSFKATSGLDRGYLGYSPLDGHLSLWNSTSAATGSLTFGTNDTERMRIDISGNVGIGTSLPGALLDVNGTAQFGFGAANKSVFSAAGGLTFAPAFVPTVAQDAATKNYVDTKLLSGGGPWSQVGSVVDLTTPGNNVVVQSTLTVQGAVGIGGTGLGNGTLVVVSTSATVGNPVADFRNNSGTSLMQVQQGGNVGIGMAPVMGQKLEVAGDVRASNFQIDAVGGAFGDVATTRMVVTSLSQMDFYSGATSRTMTLSLGNVGIATGVPQGLFDVGGGSLTVKTNGNVGIGTTGPSYKLDVQGGDINTSGVYRQGAGLVGQNVNCIVGQTPNGITTSGGIVTSVGGCVPIPTISGTPNTVVKFIGTGNQIGNSLINDNGSAIGIGSTSPLGRLTVQGAGSSYSFFVSTDINGGSGNLLVTNAGNVGIGTTGPSGTLSVQPQAAANYSLFVSSQNGVGTLVVNNQGNVGIGTTSPTNMLHVSGNFAGDLIKIANNSAGGAGGLSAYSDNFNQAQFGVGGSAAGAVANLGFVGTVTNIPFEIMAGSSEKMRILPSGNVGIGTTNPTLNLSLGNSTNKSFGIEDAGAASAAPGSALLMRSGAGGTLTTGGAGGDIVLVAGSAGGTGSNAGGSVRLQPGMNTAGGGLGSVVVDAGSAGGAHFKSLQASVPVPSMASCGVGAVPTLAAGSTDMAGQLTFTPSGASVACVITVTFSKPYSNPNPLKVMVTAANASAATVQFFGVGSPAVNTSAFTLNYTAAPANATYVYSYFVIE